MLIDDVQLQNGLLLNYIAFLLLLNFHLHRRLLYRWLILRLYSFRNEFFFNSEQRAITITCLDATTDWLVQWLDRFHNFKSSLHFKAQILFACVDDLIPKYLTLFFIKEIRFKMFLFTLGVNE
jgi:hypothetical protein